MEITIAYLADRPLFVPICATWAFFTWGKYNLSYTLEKRLKSFTEHCNKDRIPLTILAIDEGGKPIGMASLRPNDGIRPDISPWLGSVFVSPHSRGRGVGARLVKEIQAIAQLLGYQSIYLLTYEDTLPRWYGQLGWFEIGTDVCHGNPVNVMQIDLNSNFAPGQKVESTSIELNCKPDDARLVTLPNNKTPHVPTGQ